MNISRFIHSFKDIFFYKVLEFNLTDCKSVLDVGCGSNSPLRFVRKTFYSEGVDIYKPSIDKTKKSNIHDKYVVGDIRKLSKIYEPKSFDAVMAIDVIEHLEKEEGFALLKKMERIARKKIIILTPNGFLDQGHYGDNVYQDHKSGWSAKDLQKLGFKVYGLRSFKEIRGEFTTIKYKPWILWGFIAFITEPLLYFFPNFSFHLFAVKSIYNEK